MNINLENLNQELSKSFKNTDYAQWERRTTETSKKSKPNEKPKASTKLPPVTNRSSQSNSRSHTPERKCSPYCNHRKSDIHPNRIVYKTKKQLQEEENHRFLLSTRIKYIKQYISSLKDRELELIEKNRAIMEYIDRTERSANESVDVILRKYEKYQEVKKTIVDKHYEEEESEHKELIELKKELSNDLKKHQESSDLIEKELKEAQELEKRLSIYKNQEYPEKLLQINNLKKKLADNNDLHDQERDNLIEIIKSEHNRIIQHQQEVVKQVTDNVSVEAMKEMHESLKEMANYNISLKSEIEFYNYYTDELKAQVEELEKEVSDLKLDERRKVKNIVFADVCKKRGICLPEMDVVLNVENN
ncbi:Myosin heavy chain -like protein [Brachionus plicatilis]|uniref:Myosin heavy chain-like protein n=1 Tax=Brachionus plicatilis TaxID=10195 RepID=A0A3M7T716_BRAPC|nr:Myosin heavy chain -like protein [Brachionus plicatilis]